MPTTIYEGEPSPSIFTLKTAIANKYQNILDKSYMHLPQRWMFFAGLVLLYIFRVYMSSGGWYVITYAIGIYMLTLSIAFLSPKWDPELEEDDDFVLPTTSSNPQPSAFNNSDRLDPDDIKPFVRRLPEFKFWQSACKAFILGFFATLFPQLDLPVFWPLLLVYFFVLLFVTMKKQINHMIKYKYLPFTRGKKVYGH